MSLALIATATAQHVDQQGDRISLADMSDYEAFPAIAHASVFVPPLHGNGAGVVYITDFDEQLNQVRWTGRLRAMWIDAAGHLRKNSLVAGGAVLTRDAPSVDLKKRINDCQSRRSTSKAGAIAAFDESTLHASCSGVNALPVDASLWDAGTWLNAYYDPSAEQGKRAVANMSSQRDYAAAADRPASIGQRYIVTYLTDASSSTRNDHAITLGVQTPFVWNDAACLPSSDNVVASHAIAGFCGGYAKDGLPHIGNLGWLNEQYPAAAHALVDWVRGVESPERFRTRSTPDKSATYRLGDIVDSQPVAVGAPAESYDLLYNDRSYDAFRHHYRHRRQMIYVGANDGMLHAFNGGFRFSNANAQSTVDAAVYRTLPPGMRTGSGATRSGNDWVLGQEAWAFIPDNLLPHLRWLASKDYTHVFYVDGSPVVSDVRIWQNDGSDCSRSDRSRIDVHGHVCGWGTVMVVAQRLGGARIGVATQSKGDPQTLSAAYTLIDITDPERPPRVLGQITGGTLTTSSPTFVVHRESDGQLHYLLAVGSGPDAMPNATTRKSAASPKGRFGLWVYDLHSLIGGSLLPVATFEGPSAGSGESFVGDIVSADLDLNASAESIYFGITHHTRKNVADAFDGGLWKLDLRPGVSDTSDPPDWRLREVVATRVPIATRPVVAVGEGGSAQVSFVSGIPFSFNNGVGSGVAARQRHYVFSVSDPDTSMSVDERCRRHVIDAAHLRDAALAVVPFRRDARHADAPPSTDVPIDKNGCRRYAGWRYALADGSGGMTYERSAGNPLLLNGVLLVPTYRSPGDREVSNDACAIAGTCNGYLLRMFDSQSGRPVQAVSSNSSISVQDGQTTGGLPTAVAAPESAPSEHASMVKTRAACIEPVGAISCRELPLLHTLENGEISWREPASP